MSHAVARLRAERLARSLKPFTARGSREPRCPGCRVAFSHCLCDLRPPVPSNAGMCLIMHDVEPLKPSNTGWLIADVVAQTWAFGWARTAAEPALLALLADPQWQPYVVFPGEFVQPPQRVVQSLPKAPPAGTSLDGAADATGSVVRRPLFILLDATWPEARKMFRKSPYLDRFPVLSLHPEALSRYQLRRSNRSDHFCTSEVAALCLEQCPSAADRHAGQVLEAYLDVFTERYLRARQQLPVELGSAELGQLMALLT